MTRKGILFVISGPSGVGKGTVREALLEGRDDIQVSISATTRPPRKGEVDGVDYFFMDRETFLKKVEEGLFLEWANVYSNLYGTPRDFVLNHLNNGQDVLLEIDIQGALQVKEKMPEGVFIFLSPPSIEDLAKRLCQRGKDSQKSIEERLAACEQEMQQMCHYDYVVINDRVEDAVSKIEAIIAAERCRIHQ
ncbi:MAG: guanylate kinase [Syntrophomonadaceae bacterium]|nr:guanylate kinase [Bacillota bacterium]NLM88720.1 guanylate kinase [Syntrophomonadaceae bacterium]HAA09201.1 guanylate kinase [Syntrophomonas sp.]HQA49399.1 guanylate kinase [Syntrophomonadaceae bacterium]HQD90247.1 guanylate kinase [Syntrophomonadaceae bacterium]